MPDNRLLKGICKKTSCSEGGRLSGSLVVGAGGGLLATYGVCNLMFGIESAGTSLLWCGIVAGVGGSYIGGKLLGAGGQQLGNVLYETTYR